MIANTDIAPLYQKIKRYISDKIHSGEFPPNGRVPSEHELVREFSVSRMTVNRALRELATEGLLARVPGVGTFVAQTQTTGHLLQVTSIAEDVRERGHQYSASVITHGQVKPPKEVADWMKISARTKAFYTVVLHEENGVPIQLEERYVNPVGAPDYGCIDLEKSTPSEFLLANVPLQRVRHTVRTTMPSENVSQKLGMSPNVPCLILDRKTWSQSTPISFVHLYHSGDTYALSDTFLPTKQ